jgi:hypothetical protein
MLWREALAEVAAERGEAEHAERLAREAVELGHRTDMLVATGDAHLALASVLRAEAKARGAAAEARRALALYERKGDEVMAERARALLAELESTVARV